MRLGAARGKMMEVDLLTFADADVIGPGRGVMIDHNWVVLRQLPAAGMTMVKTNTEIKLGVGKVDDPEIRAQLPLDAPVILELTAAEKKAAAEQAEKAAKAADEKAAKTAEAAAAAKAKAAATVAQNDPATYAAIGKRDFALIAKDPDAHVGEKYVLYGAISQFDTNTGPNAFLARTDGEQHTYSYEYDENAFVQAENPSLLAKVVKGDLVKMYVQVVGSYSYDTQIGGHATATKVQVNIIKVTG